MTPHQHEGRVELATAIADATAHVAEIDAVVPTNTYAADTAGVLTLCRSIAMTEASHSNF
jgi:hypothetical protein